MMTKNGSESRVQKGSFLKRNNARETAEIAHPHTIV